MKNDLPIIKKMKDFYKQFYCYRKRFPKQDRHLLGAKCEQYTSDILELLLNIPFQNATERVRTIKIANRKFDMLKLLIRLLYELQVIDQRRYLILEKQLQEIGQQFGGWIKSLS